MTRARVTHGLPGWVLTTGDVVAVVGIVTASAFTVALLMGWLG